MTRFTPALIGGAWVAARDGAVMERRDPAATDQIVVEVPSMGPDDVAAALDAARDGARVWADLGAVGRGRVLLDAARLIAERREEIARDVVREMGKTLTEATAEVASAAAFFEYFGGYGRAELGQVLPDRRPDVDTWSVREPLGVVALITPWNDPVATPARKLAPALISGNAVVLKPSPETPLSALHIGRALVDAGLPAGVLNIVTGEVGRVATPLLDDPRVSALSFTGSTRVGLELRRRLSDRMRIQTEMGGKNAVLVLPDADLTLARTTILAAAFGQSGQRCTATSRLIVHRAVASELEEELVGAVGALTVGRGDTPGTDVGPLVSEPQLEGALGAIARARDEGARVLVGGERLTDAPFDRGHFLSPSVIGDVTDRMDLWRQEVFGPVLSMSVVDHFEEGIAAVNDTSYGLSASVFTTDLRAAHRFAHEADAGQIAVNLPTTGWDVHVPFGGFKDSGSAFKEHGVEGTRFYTRVKSVAMGFGARSGG